MMRMTKLAIPAAAALAMAPMAQAQVATDTTPMTDMTNIVLAENLIEAEVRAIELDDTTWGTDYYVEPYAYDAEMENIGEVEDIALGSDGMMQGLIVDVGGFLGLGEHRVMLTPDQFRVYRQDGWGEDYQVVSRLTRDELGALPEFDLDD